MAKMASSGKKINGNSIKIRKEKIISKCLKKEEHKIVENGLEDKICNNCFKNFSRTTQNILKTNINSSIMLADILFNKSNRNIRTSSMFKIFFLAQVFLMQFQFSVCESSSKWWSILNEVSEDLVEDESANPQYTDPYKPQGMSHDFVSGDPSFTDSLYGNIGDLTFRDENGERIISDEEIFKILGAQNQQGGAKLSGYFEQKQNEKVQTISSRRKTQGDYTRNNRDVSNNLVESSILKPHEKIKPSSYIIEKRVRKLNKKQRRVLRNNPGIIEQISIGIREALKECKHQFRKRQWRCSVESGYKETAYMYAVTSAAVAHAVAKGCAKGKIEACGCDSKIRGMGGPDWQWGGCSDNIHFGMQFSRDFVDAAETGFDLKYRVNMHNNEAGRQIVKDKTKKFCKCHGTSGSCTVKTCWLRVDSFRRVAKKLRNKYDKSKKVTQPNDGHTAYLLKKYSDYHWRMADKSEKQPKKEDLVYYENSPDFCNLGSDRKLDTRGRTCNATATGPDSCSEMCCGRGYRVKEKTIRKQCDCDFKWCCKVRCKICHEKTKVHICN